MVDPLRYKQILRSLFRIIQSFYLIFVRVLLHVIDCSEKNFIDNYSIIRNEITKYGKNLIEKKELIAFSKSDLISEDKKKLSEIIEKKTGKRPYVFSNISNEGIENLVIALFDQCLNND